MANRTAKSSQSSHLEQAKIEYLEPFADEVLRCKRLLGEAQYNLDKAYYLGADMGDDACTTCGKTAQRGMLWASGEAN